MNELVEDIIRLIFDIIYNEDVKPPWSTLARLSLINKQWSQHAQALLYASVRIENSHQAEAFLASTNLKTERGLRLASQVKILKLTVYPPGYVTRVVSTQFPSILARCRKLYELRITLEDLEAWDQETLNALRRTSPPILALRIRDSMTSGIAARQILHIWPSIRHLSLRSSSVGLLAAGIDEPSPKFNLYEFRWEGMRPQSVRFLLWLLNYDNADKTENYLRILHLSALPPDDHDGRLASYYGSHLHSLRVPHADGALIKATINLKEIYLLYGEDITVPLLLSLPPTMEHIACVVLHDRTQAVENVLQVKQGGFGLRNLRAMSLYRPTATQWPAFQLLAVKARRLGVDLIRHEHRGLLVGGSEDMIAVDRFPRLTTTRQFNRMAYAVDAIPTAYNSNETDKEMPRIRRLTTDPDLVDNSHAHSFESLSRHPTPFMQPIQTSTSHSGSFHAKHTIRLDPPSPHTSIVTPRAWDYDYDRPLERIVLDDPKPKDESQRKEAWRKVRSSLTIIKQKVSGKGL